MRELRSEGAVLEVCPECQGTFVDLSDALKWGLDITALFDVGPEQARACGVSQLRCWTCDSDMQVFYLETLFGDVEVDWAGCCGAVFLDGGEQNIFEKAALRAQQLRSDREWAAGQPLTALPEPRRPAAPSAEERMQKELADMKFKLRAAITLARIEGRKL